MWERATWHECADELDSVCQCFRHAYWGKHSRGWPRHPADIAEMEDTSRKGVQLLRSLALAVRSEQDFNLAPHCASVVGIIKNENVNPRDTYDAKQHGGFSGMLKIDGYAPLNLRQALNKIAHADPQTADYYVQTMDMTHDLLLFGENHGKKWFAVISILELIKAIRALPDATMVMP
jgi:hypothetical protein